MKSQIVTRRGLLSKAALALVGMAVAGCETTNVHGEKEEDWVQTLAAVVLLFIIVGVIAASRRDDDSSKNSDQKKKPIEEEGDIKLANVRIRVGDGCECISVADCAGNALAKVIDSGAVEYDNLDIAKSLFAGEDQARFPAWPIAIHLQEDVTGQHRIENVQTIQAMSSDDDFSELLSQSIEGRFYVSRMRKVSGGIVVEVASPAA